MPYICTLPSCSPSQDSRLLNAGDGPQRRHSCPTLYRRRETTPPGLLAPRRSTTRTIRPVQVYTHSVYVQKPCPLDSRATPSMCTDIFWYCSVVICCMLLVITLRLQCDWLVPSFSLEVAGTCHGRLSVLMCHGRLSVLMCHGRLSVLMLVVPYVVI